MKMFRSNPNQLQVTAKQWARDVRFCIVWCLANRSPAKRHYWVCQARLYYDWIRQGELGNGVDWRCAESREKAAANLLSCAIDGDIYSWLMFYIPFIGCRISDSLDYGDFDRIAIDIVGRYREDEL